jgi:hypothetical protein
VSLQAEGQLQQLQAEVHRREQQLLELQAQLEQQQQQQRAGRSAGGGAAASGAGGAAGGGAAASGSGPPPLIARSPAARAAVSAATPASSGSSRKRRLSGSGRVQLPPLQLGAATPQQHRRGQLADAEQCLAADSVPVLLPPKDSSCEDMAAAAEQRDEVMEQMGKERAIQSSNHEMPPLLTALQELQVRSLTQAAARTRPTLQ